MRLILIRHGESSWNRERRIQGISNIELNERGRKQAEKIAIALRGEKVDAIYSSPLKRAVDTAKAIAQVHHLEVNIEPDLRELDVGELDGLREKEVNQRYGEFWKEWRKGDGSIHLPGGESLEELQRRAWRAIQHIDGKHSNEVVIVVSHLFAIRTIICQALGLELGKSGRLKQDVAAISILNLEEQGSSLVLFNDTCHLEAV